MKFLRGQVFGLLVLVGGIVPLQGMMQQGTRQRLQRIKLSGKPSTQQPIVVNIPTPQTGEPSGEDVGEKPIQYSPLSEGQGKVFGSTSELAESEDTELGKRLRSWWRSLWYRPQTASQPVNVSSEEIATSPFGQGGQKRMYSSRPQSESWWSKLQLKLNLRDLTPEEFTQKIHELLYTPRDKEWMSSRGRTYKISIFDENDLQKAKGEIDQIIERNPSYKEYIMTNNYLSPFWSSPVELKGTILDEVLYKAFSGDAVWYGRDNFCPTDNELNYIKLAHHLIDKGIKINPENEKNYILGYLNLLMKEYKKLYGPSPASYDMPEDALKKLKATFKALDPLLEQVISNKELKDKLHEAQQERKNIEATEQQYREKLQRDEYLWEKARYQTRMGEYEFIRRGKDYLDAPELEFYHEKLKKEPFNEIEYQTWLKSGKDERYFNPSYEQQRETRFEFGPVSTKNKLTQLLGIAASSSEKEISDAYRKFAIQHHPDVTKDPNNPMSLKLKHEINPAWDEYNKALSAVKQGKVSRE